MYRSLVLVLCTATSCGWSLGACAAAPDRTADEQAIRTAAQEYVAALTRGDVKTALGYWTADGDIVDESGRSSQARERIEQDAKLAVASESSAEAPTLPNTTIRFVGPGTAIEDGPYGSSGRFSAIWTKTDGGWKLAALRESRSESQPLADLAQLDWMVGRWIGEHDGTTYEITARWNEPHTYLERTFVATHNGTVLIKAQQRIGVDPEDGRVKSWIHDAEGGHAEGVWSRLGDRWTVETRGVAADGEDLRGTSVYTPEGEKQIRWESLNNWRGGQPMLDFEVTLSRSAEN